MAIKLSIPRYEGVHGLPGPRVITIANSERSSMACPRRGWFRHIEYLKTESTSPQRRGLAWHEVTEDIHRWWQSFDTTYPEKGAIECAWCGGSGIPVALPALAFETKGRAPEGNEPCPVCDGTGLGPAERYWKTLVAARSADGARLVNDEDARDEYRMLLRWYDGWSLKYGLDPYKTLRVIGVEVPIARAILNPKTGRPFKPTVFVVHEPGSMRLASTGEVSGGVPLPAGATIGKIRYPWYQVGRLDGILQNRGGNGGVYVDEWKSSQTPTELIKGLTVDPQTEGYCWLLEGLVEDGTIPGPVNGYLYDVTRSSRHSDPKVLKRGGLSKAKNVATPSWRFEAAVTTHGLDLADYAEHIEWCKKNVDPKLYLREWGTSDPDARQRYAEEVYSAASTAATRRRAAARASSETDLNIHFPRVPVCKSGGFCSYRGPCIEDGAEARASFTTSTGPVWTTGE